MPIGLIYTTVRHTATTWCNNTRELQLSTFYLLKLSTFSIMLHAASKISKSDFQSRSNLLINVNRETLWFPCCGVSMCGDDNKTTVTAKVNIYAVDFKGQTLVHVSLAFSHLQAETRSTDVRESLMWSETWKEKAGGCVEKPFEDSLGENKAVYLCVSG